MPSGSSRQPSPTQPVLGLAIRDALAFPALILLSSMTGFGSLARDGGFTLAAALATTIGIWGLPGQVALVELHAAGAETAATLLASSLANARFLPMAVAFLPLMRKDLAHKAWGFALVQLMSINTWVAALRVAPRLGGPERRRYYLIFSGVVMAAALAGTALGFQASGALPEAVTLGLIFLNPIFFALMFAGSTDRRIIVALLLGALAGPALHPFLPQYGLLVTGVAAGTAAFFLTRRRGRTR